MYMYAEIHYNNIMIPGLWQRVGESSRWPTMYLCVCVCVCGVCVLAHYVSLCVSRPTMYLSVCVCGVFVLLVCVFLLSC